MRLHRLCGSAEYRSTLKRGKKTHSPMFVFYSKDNDNNTARLGLSVPARTTRKSNHRNTIKRAVRETFRKKRTLLPGRDYIVICKGLNHHDPHKTQADLNIFWDKEIGSTPLTEPYCG